MPAFLDGLFLSEILADNIGSGSNTDGDNSTNKSDEYIELQNNSGGTIDLSNYQIWSQTNGLLYDFSTAPVTPDIADGATATVVGEYTGTPPAGFYDSGDNNGQNFIPDGETVGNNVRADVIYLLNTTTGDYIYLSYGTDPLTISPPFPTTGTTEVGGEIIASGAPNATSILRDADGNLIEGTPTPGTPGPVCFALGTQILTPLGERCIEDIKIGDLVVTKDHGAQPVRWTSTTQYVWPGAEEKHKPILIPANAFGARKPHRDLVVSAQHKLLLEDASNMGDIGFGEYLAPAKGLLGLPGVRNMLGKQQVTYVHLMLDQHSILFSEGIASESFYPGPTALAMLTAVQRCEINRLFPALRGDPENGYGPKVRKFLSYRQTVELAAKLDVAGGPEKVCH